MYSLFCSLKLCSKFKIGKISFLELKVLELHALQFMKLGKIEQIFENVKSNENMFPFPPFSSL